MKLGQEQEQGLELGQGLGKGMHRERLHPVQDDLFPVLHHGEEAAGEEEDRLGAGMLEEALKRLKCS